MARICTANDILGLGVCRIGFLGGSFDPPHEGHLRLMERVLLDEHVDHLIVCPHSLNPAKMHRLADIFHRLQMVDILISRSDISSRISTCDPCFVHGLQNSEFHTVAVQLMMSGLEVWIVLGQDAVRRDYSEWLRNLPHIVVSRMGYSSGSNDVLTGPVVLAPPVGNHKSCSVRAQLSDGLPHPIPEVDLYIRTEALYR